jgi:hypothetical protein
LWVDVPAADGRIVRLCDFASAGATGLRYRSWLPAAAPPPPPPIPRAPADGATIGAGRTTFRWTSKPDALLTNYLVVVARDPEGRLPLAEFGPVAQPRLTLEDTAKQRLPARTELWWKVLARGPNGETPSQQPLARFFYDPSAPSSPQDEELAPGPEGIVVRAPLQKDAQPEYGRLERDPEFSLVSEPAGAITNAVRLNGRDQMLVYALPEDFGEDYSAAVWVRVRELPAGRIGQVLSLWAGGMDDPLRLTVDGGQLFARIEAQKVFSTRGLSIQPGVWYHVAAVKAGAKLTLYLNGEAQQTIAVPEVIHTSARVCALGGNPNYSGPEFLHADFAEFALFARALSAAEVAACAKR